MKNLLRKLNRASTNEEVSDGPKRAQDGAAGLSKGRTSSTDSNSTGDSKLLFGLPGWLNSVARHTLQTGSSNATSPGGSNEGSNKDKMEAAEKNQMVESVEAIAPPPRLDAPVARLSLDELAINAGNSDTAKAAQQNEQLLSLAEEYQVQLAMALSVRDDPEAVQIERVKQISLNSNPSSLSTPAEVLAYQYWNYNVLNYDDKIVDGFYDVYGVVSDPTPEMMPSLVDLQGASVSNNYTWEAVLVNRATDPDLINLEQSALVRALDCKDDILQLSTSSRLIQRIADLVVMHMGGPVADPDDVLKQWRISSEELKLNLGNIVLPLGRLRMGLARHRALLFKVLADGVGIPCRLVKGRQYTGSDEGALNIIRMDDKREYIVDLMGAPGTLIPCDGTELLLPGFNTSHEKGMKDDRESVGLSADFVLQHSENADPGNTSSVSEHLSNQEHVSNSKIDSPVKQEALEDMQKIYAEDRNKEKGIIEVSKHVERYLSEPPEIQGFPVRTAGTRSSHPFAHGRSPSWTEGIGSPAVRDMKVKDVSQYMVDAAKENPGFAQKLHNVLLESGVKAPPDLFGDISPKQLQAQAAEDKKILEQKQSKGGENTNKILEIAEKEKCMEDEARTKVKPAAARKEKSSVGPGRPPAPPKRSTEADEALKDRLQRLNSVEGLGERRPLAYSHPSTSPVSSSTGSANQIHNPASPVASVLTVFQESLPPEVIKRVPVAAAAAATAAVVASSMVVAAAKSELVSDPTLEVPVAAAATATAAVVVATSAVVGRKLEAIEAVPIAGHKEVQDCNRSAQGDSSRSEDTSPVRSAEGEGGLDFIAEEEKASDRSTDSIAGRSNTLLDDVAEWEILWEDITIGERIGLGSYGEVYRGEWHGTEVAVKKFLNQDLSGDALEEFRSEVRLMRRMRHPNVVLFMGAVTRAPNLSIVTEFLPRGSLYRLIHRPNNQLDERKRMRMALDVAKGMNYLHSGTPIIVHRDLKSPNLLVDKNWVVKVCDFGLSRMKHNTFLSSKSTAGTPEWMAPEVLRNEPSNEKCDVYSFGVILWELATLQRPWNGMNPMQVVGAVGFQDRRLDIPDELDPTIAKIICQCWESDPNLRPSFAEILAVLKPLQKSLVGPRVMESG